MNRIILLLIFGGIGWVNSLVAQQNANTLLWKIAEENTVLLKWYSAEIYSSETVNIYRKETDAAEDSWIKLNAAPIARLEEVPDAAPNSEELLFAEAIKKGVGPEAQEIFNLLILLKSFDSTPFSQFLGVYFADETARAGRVYQYKVMSVNSGGREDEFAISTPVPVGGPQRFAAPEEVEADGSNDRVNFKWKVETSRYYGVDIYRSEERNGDFVKINPKPLLISQIEKEDGTESYPEIFYADDSLQTDQTYYYYLTARGFFADTSEPTEIFEIRVRDEIPPAQVQGLTFIRPDPQGLAIDLAWEKVADTDLAGYLVQRKVTGDFVTVSRLIPADQTTYTDLVPRTESYLYRIVSQDNAGNQTPGSEMIVNVTDNTPPVAPLNLTAEGTEGAILLSWDANVEPDVLGYFVYRVENGYRDREMLLLTAEVWTTNTFVDSLPKIAKNTFAYRVVALDSSYNISPKSDFSEAKMPDVTPPVSPVIKRGYLDGTAIRLEWLPNLDDDLAGYALYRSRDGLSNWEVMHTDGLLDLATVQFVDEELEAGQTYFYRLYAFDSIGNRSEPSNIYKASSPPPVARVSPAPVLSIKYEKKNAAITIRWKAKRDAAMTGMLIFRKEGSGRFLPVSAMLTEERDFTDTAIELEKTYSYQLRAYYTDGNITRSEPVEIVAK